MESQGMDNISSEYTIGHYPNFITIQPTFSPPQINFLFTCSFTISVENIPEHHLLMHANVSVSLEQFHRYPETHALIRENIKHMPIFEGQVIDSLIESAYRQAEASIPAANAHLYVRSHLIARHNMADMVPADDSSIETRELTLGSCCCICLEEFSDLCAEMPCQHIFHRDCIVEWLNVNRSCPMCRFQMP